MTAKATPARTSGHSALVAGAALGRLPWVHAPRKPGARHDRNDRRPPQLALSARILDREPGDLFERAAYYGTFIALRTYLLRVVHLDDVQAGTVAGLFGALIYLFPFFSGAIADRLGFRSSLMLAFGLLALGYAAGLVSLFWPVMGALLLVVIGGSSASPSSRARP